MILYLYSNYNRKAGFFLPLITENINPQEMVENYPQVVYDMPQEVLERLNECDLYYMGTIDNISGEIKNEKVFLLNCGDVCSKFLKKSKESEDLVDGRKEEC